MARFRVWGHEYNWYDCIDTDMFIRSDQGEWVPLEPDKFSVRGVYGYRWYDIDDQFDPLFDDPCLFIENGECGGGPTSVTKGSGDGIGSQGPIFDPLKGYPPGFDLPDAGRTGFGLRNTGASPTGRSIRRPGIKILESYDPVGHTSRSGLGTWDNPNKPYQSIHSRGAIITETIYAMPPYGGYIEILFTSYHVSGLSLDVYHMGERVASTCGKVGGRSRIKFEFDPTQDDLRLMLRVRADQGSTWSLQVLPPSLATPPDRGNLALDHQASYNVIGFPDVINPRYIGTPIFPAPCHATVWPLVERIQESNAFEYYHYVGTEAGWMYVDYSSWENLDFIEVYHAGRRIASSLDAQTDRGHLHFYYDPLDTQNYDLMVRVVSGDFEENEGLQTVYYSMYCPSQRGSRAYRHPCESYSIYSAGHPFTEDNFQLIRHTDMRAILVQVNAVSFKTFFELFDGDHIHGVEHRLDTETTEGRGTLEAWFTPDPEHDNRAQIAVRATSAIGCDWYYFAYCPIQPPKIRIPDYVVPYRCIEGTETQVEDTDGFRPPYAVGEWDWKLVAQSRAGANQIDYQWKDNHEYMVISRFGSEFRTRNIFAYSELLPSNVRQDIAFLDYDNFSLGGTNVFNPSSQRWVKMYRGGEIHFIFERPFIVSSSAEGVKDTNSWRLMGPNHRWEHGYEYVIFIHDHSGDLEMAQKRYILPPAEFKGPSPTPWWFIDTTNSSDINVDWDGRIWSRVAWRSSQTTINIIRRPLFMDDGSGESLLWKRDFYVDSWPSGTRPLAWDYGREYTVMNWHGGNQTAAASYQHATPLHMLDLRYGRSGSPATFSGWNGQIRQSSYGASALRGGLSALSERSAQALGDDRGVWQVLSRPFRYHEQFEIMDKYLDLANILE